MTRTCQGQAVSALTLVSMQHGIEPMGLIMPILCTRAQCGVNDADLAMIISGSHSCQGDYLPGTGTMPSFGNTPLL